VPAFAGLCCRGAAFTLLFRLKSFLQQLYNLSDARITEYDPNGKESTADKGITKSTRATAVFDSTVGCGPGRGQAVNCGDLDLDQLIRLYAEFRRMMRAESVDADAEFLDHDEGDDGGNRSQREDGGVGLLPLSPLRSTEPTDKKPRGSPLASR
jgi:hypothetical protein